MKIKLIFSDWEKNSKSIYATDKGIDLTMGDFHSGSTFDAEVNLNEEQEQELKQAIQDGYDPVFRAASD